MERRAALQASLAGVAVALVPSVALGSAIKVPEEDYVLVDWDGELTFVGDWQGHRDYIEEDLAAEIEFLRIDPDHQVFSNFPIVCLDPELQARVTVLLGASEAEVDAERERWDSAACVLAEREGFSMLDPDALKRLPA